MLVFVSKALSFRYRFVYHRKTYHQPVLEFNHLQNCPVSTREQAIAVHETNSRELINSGHIVQLMNPDEALDDELYVFMTEEDNSGIFLSSSQLL